MKRLHFILLIPFIYINISCQTNKYDNLCNELDRVLYFDNRLVKIDSIVQMAISTGFYDYDLIAKINEFETYYSNIVEREVFNDIWSSGQNGFGAGLNSVHFEALRLEPNQYLIKLLDDLSKNNKKIAEFSIAYQEIGIIPTGIEVLNLMSSLDISNRNERLIYYLYFITWFSNFPDCWPPANCDE